MLSLQCCSDLNVPFLSTELKLWSRSSWTLISNAAILTWIWIHPFFPQLDVSKHCCKNHSGLTCGQDLILLFRSSFWLFAYFLASLPRLVVLQTAIAFWFVSHTHTHTHPALVLWRTWSESLRKMSEIFKALLALQTYLTLHFFEV